MNRALKVIGALLVWALSSAVLVGMCLLSISQPVITAAIVVALGSLTVSGALFAMGRHRPAFIAALSPAFAVGALLAVMSVFNLVFSVGSVFAAIHERVVAKAPPSQKVELEVQEEKSYDPPWLIKHDSQAKTSEWEELSWDEVRYRNCKHLLKESRSEEDPKHRLRMFTNDRTGKKTVRDTAYQLCDSQAIWFFDYAAEPRRTTIAKYSHAGDLIYRVSFADPDEPLGCGGGIMWPTFAEEGRYLKFEWWNTQQSGWDRKVVRSMRVRIEEPQSMPRSAP